MAFKSEIKQMSTLTKRFQRDTTKLFQEIKGRVQAGGLTKEEVKALVETFGKKICLVPF